VLSEINKAKCEIFITDWWLSPELHLKRPSIDDNNRLDIVLQKAAERGVKIYILVYKEVSIVLPLNSFHTKKHLEKLHSNITVLRHPPSLIFLWSHHEKIIIIDQRIGFLGGLDLCFGRMDNQKHFLFDQEDYWIGNLLLYFYNSN
jgi:phospholipase D1/2